MGALVADRCPEACLDESDRDSPSWRPLVLILPAAAWTRRDVGVVCLPSTTSRDGIDAVRGTKVAAALQSRIVVQMTNKPPMPTATSYSWPFLAKTDVLEIASLEGALLILLMFSFRFRMISSRFVIMYYYSAPRKWAPSSGCMGQCGHLCTSKAPEFVCAVFVKAKETRPTPR